MHANIVFQNSYIKKCSDSQTPHLVYEFIFDIDQRIYITINS